jgi:hypothetical protein
MADKDWKNKEIITRATIENDNLSPTPFSSS